MKYYGEINQGLSEKEKQYQINRQRNADGWFDKIWEKMDFSTNQRRVLLNGDAVMAQNETCCARYQLTMCGDLQMVICHSGETKCVTINRLSGEKKVDFYVRHPFEYETEVDDADNII